MGKRVNHGFPPFIPEDARVLILGSFPSVRSRAFGFFYMHPQNRFFKALALVYGEREPLTIGERKDFLIRHRIALYDVIESCSISGSADGSIKDAVPADIPSILAGYPTIVAVLTTGGLAHRLYTRFFGGGDIPLPSSSPANAACHLEELVERYRIIREKVGD